MGFLWVLNAGFHPLFQIKRKKLGKNQTQLDIINYNKNIVNLY